MKKTILIITIQWCSLNTVFGMSDYQYLRECAKENAALSSRVNQTDGFQGCINKERCGSYGFYFQTFSKEGLCTNCELERYPERFTGCFFCRMPWKGFSACRDCENKVEKFIAEKFVKTSECMDKDTLDIAAHKYLSNIKHSLTRKCIKTFIDHKIRHKLFDTNFYSYLGCKKLKNGNILHLWAQNLTIDPQDKKLVSRRTDADEHVKYIFEKYSVLGPETGTEYTADIPADCLTYEEVVNSSQS